MIYSQCLGALDVCFYIGDRLPIPFALRSHPVSSAVFISYRRKDASFAAGRLYDDLTKKLGEGSVFKDADSIPLAGDFRQHIDHAVRECDVFLALISTSWTERLKDPQDYVRLEIETALHHGITVIPVLLSDIPMPSPDVMPESIQALAFRQASKLRPGVDWGADVQRLIGAMAPFTSSTRAKRTAIAVVNVVKNKGIYPATFGILSLILPIIIHISGADSYIEYHYLSAITSGVMAGYAGSGLLEPKNKASLVNTLIVSSIICISSGVLYSTLMGIVYYKEYVPGFIAHFELVTDFILINTIPFNIAGFLLSRRPFRLARLTSE